MALIISLLEEASYFPYPSAEDHVDYAIIPVVNGMTQVIGSTSEFLVGRLLLVIESEVMNVVLPPAFGLDADAWDFNWVPHPVWAAMWANYQLMDADKGDKNFTHMVLVAPLDVFRTDSRDQV